MAKKYQELPEISCYVHSVSPVKKSNGSTYINCDIQTESSVVRAVCFATEKHQSLDALAVQKSPVKIRNYTISKKTSIVPGEATFDYLSMDKNIDIASLSQVAADQLVRVKGTVKELTGVKNVIFDKYSVEKQQCYIVDPSGFLKLIIWGSHVNTVEEGGTYNFDKVRVKVTKSERYVNTPKCECTITSADPFVESLPDVEAVSTTSEITANILGVSSAVKSMCCLSCGKKVAMKGKLAFCESCKMFQKPKSCKMQWYVRMYVEKVGIPEQRLRLIAFNDVSNKLLEICDLPQTSSEEELTESILQLDTVFISFDEQTNKLIDVDVVNI